MRQCYSSVLIFTCFTCLGFYPSRASIANPNLLPLTIAQASSKVPTQSGVLKLGSQGLDVKVLQTQLQKLGYYSGSVDGKYTPSTQTAVAKFQKAKNLKRVDGIADLATKRNLRAAMAAKFQPVNSLVIDPFTPTPQPTASITPQPAQKGFIWWSLFGLGILGSIGAFLFLMKWFRQQKQVQQLPTSEMKALSPAKEDFVTPPLQKLHNIPIQQENTASVINPETAKASTPTTLLPLEKTSRIPKVNVVEELIQDLRSNDPKKRRKAIWSLSQQGDSRAIQPLVNLMVDADSQERSLILAALAEINVRILKPLNRALAISMQDESPQVRQNAIRDLTRVYDMMSQMNQLLSHALEDPDAEVQSTAKYALNQMNKMRGLLTQPSLPEATETDIWQDDEIS
ncbi:peptidoglycan-binding protein [Halotia branconii]|uniref:Peptidoglycan-binding protein n=1 Tax=Halotia branconii CENA392 TaxID=1539056 RepID=A0AAJ6PA32_9CYAN|nr:peptidoglycan-binding protein [Halotia branconii]WGV26296.1 peptidoglycan-binding protein [Halotia branconii CENA392]